MGFDEIVRQNPFIAYEIAVDRGYANEKLEEIIATDAELSYYYAYDLLGGERFPLGEPAIAEDSYWSLSYAQNIIGGRFELGEPAIAKDPRWSFEYAADVLKTRFPQGEEAIRGSEWQSDYEEEFGLESNFESL